MIHRVGLSAAITTVTIDRIEGQTPGLPLKVKTMITLRMSWNLIEHTAYLFKRKNKKREGKTVKPKETELLLFSKHNTKKWGEGENVVARELSCTEGRGEKVWSQEPYAGIILSSEYS